MNEQLVQELAVQIDGQIAQSCGSHDPNVKSSYIIQKYPQVRSCANYSEAVLLLAREQAALQAPQMGYGHTPQPTFGQQHNSLGQLQSGFGRNNQQQSSGFGGSQAGGFGQPQAGGFVNLRQVGSVNHRQVGSVSLNLSSLAGSDSKALEFLLKVLVLHHLRGYSGNLQYLRQVR